MDVGKISEKILKRSITNIIGRGPVSGIDAASFPGKADYILTSTQVGTIDNPLNGTLVVYKAANNIWAAGGELTGIQTAFIFPPKMKERDIKALTRQIIKAAKECNTYILGGHTQVSDSVVRPVVTITAIGKTDNTPGNVRGVRPGWDIILSKWAGLEETALALQDESVYGRLTEHFDASYFYEMEDCASWLTIEREAAIAKKYGALMHDLSEDGVFGALWDMSEASSYGFVIDVGKIPFRQQTTEICTYLSKDAYRVKSSGSLMMVCDNGYALTEALDKEGIPSVIIGQVSDNNDKIVMNGEEIRYLDKK